MNANINTTAPAASATARVEQLVAAHINAVTEHERRFQLRGHGLAGQEEVNAALKSVEETLVALCGARPETAAEAELKSTYLRDNLAEAACENADLLNAAIGALIDAGRPADVGQADHEAERPCRLKGLMAELSVELMRWRGGGHRAVIYPADCAQPNSLQDMLLLPAEPAPPVRMAGDQHVRGLVRDAAEARHSATCADRTEPVSVAALARLEDAIWEAITASGIAATVMESSFSGTPSATEDGWQYLVPRDAANRMQFAATQVERLLHVVDDIVDEL